MSNTAWGNLLLPGIRHWATYEFPHVFLEVRLHEDMVQDACVFAFRLVNGVWVTATIYNEVFYDAKNPTEEIMAIIKGQFAELLAPQIKHTFKFGFAVTKEMIEDNVNSPHMEWTVPYVIEVLKHNFPDYTFYAKALGPGIISVVTHFGKKTKQTILTTTWLKQHGIQGFLDHIAQLVNLSYKPKPGEYSSQPKQVKYFDDTLQQYINYAAKKTGVFEYAYGVHPGDRTGQFYEDGDNWIPVGLTLADIT